MQYESNPANGFRDIVGNETLTHRRTFAQPDMVMTIKIKGQEIGRRS